MKTYSGPTHSPRRFNPWDEEEVRESINVHTAPTPQQRIDSIREELSQVDHTKIGAKETVDRLQAEMRQCFNDMPQIGY